MITHLTLDILEDKENCHHCLFFFVAPKRKDGKSPTLEKGTMFYVREDAENYCSKLNEQYDGVFKVFQAIAVIPENQ